MTEIEPRVHLLAETRLLPGTAVINWLDSLGGAKVLNHLSGHDAEKLIELAGRRCYKSFAPGLNPNVRSVRTDSQDYHANILSSGHGSVLEHATCTWAIEGVSRVFTHELVRNRAGNAFSQESLRYVRLTELGFWLPPEIAEHPEAAAVFREAVAGLEAYQQKLTALFFGPATQHMPFDEKKKLTSAFRRIAPEGLATGIVLTTNFRSLRWLIEQRTGPAAEAEMRLVIGKIAEVARARWHHVFGDFSVDPDGAWVPQHHKV